MAGEGERAAAAPGEGPGPAAPGGPVVVFDLGGVLIDWDPRYLYRGLIPDEAAMEAFLASVTTREWNHRQDAGRPWADAVEELTARHPEHRELIRAYDERWEEMLAGELPGTVRVLAELRDRGVVLYALTNWSREKFHHARERFAFLAWFRAILVSGEVGLAKPDPEVFRLMCREWALDPARVVLVDDAPANVEAAAALGIDALLFTDAAALRAALGRRGLLEAQT